MKSIIYLSEESMDFNEEELKELSSSSEQRNKDRGITGFMSYKNGIFVQFLQGPDSAVDQLFNTINKDERHSVKKSLELPFDEELFPAWGMRYYGHAQLGPTRFEDILELLLSRLSTTLSEAQVAKLVASNIERIASN
ncbi:BLUF domain-containing protein [Cryomorphaceae bacterium]|nr:BLUF domain-containing protein [Cryomorphaceae bacterium]